MVLKLHPGNVEAQNEVKHITEVSVKASFQGSASFLKSSSLYLLTIIGCFQTLRHQAPAVLSEATQEAPTVAPEQQGGQEEGSRREEEEEQQKRQEAAVQKDRVSFATCWG